VSSGAGRAGALQAVVGAAALAAPALHSATDVMEWSQHGFSQAQLWLNYLAFLPMPWLLLGIYAVHEVKPGAAGLAGAVLHGIAFTYFAHTTLYALAEKAPDYEAMWTKLGTTYTVHGALMVVGGLLFAGSVFRAGWLPRPAIALFAAGLVLNLVLALVPVPDLLQTLGTALRNAGLVGMGWFLLRGRSAHA